MDRFEAMSAFVAVSKAGSFSAVARELGIPLATVSRRVADLEAELGVRLLHRSTRKLSLTSEGRDFFTSCVKILDDLREATEQVTGEHKALRGALTVTAPTGFGRLHLQPIVQSFLGENPSLQMRLILADQVVNLVDERVDAAIRIAELPDSTMVARTLGEVRVILCASPDYLARRGHPAHPCDLQSHDCIAWSTLVPLDGWWFRAEGLDRLFPIAVRLSTTVAESAISAAEAGLGIVQTTSYQAEQSLRAGKLTMLLPEFECKPTPVSLIYPGHRMLPLKVRSFVDFAAPKLERRLRSISSAIDTPERLTV